eukprot:SAG11_NODE_85_length_17370_cov_29.272017_14_plen_215_part_00
MASASELETILARLATVADDKLAPILSKLLPKLLEPNMITSTDVNTRAGVLNVVKHVNKRVRGNSSIQLPVPEILAGYALREPSAVVNNFAIMYIEMGLPRMPSTAKPELFPLLLRQVTARPAAQQQTLCHLALDLAANFVLPTDPAAAEALCSSISALPAELDFICEFYKDVLLYFPPLSPEFLAAVRPAVLVYPHHMYTVLCAPALRLGSFA